MSDPGEAVPEAAYVVWRWLTLASSGDLSAWTSDEWPAPVSSPRNELWVPLDDDLRLALAQQYLLGRCAVRSDRGGDRDALAAALAQRQSEHPWFDEMLAGYRDCWRNAYRMIDGDPAVADTSVIAGIDLEAVLFTSGDNAGEVTCPIPGHTFVMRLDAHRGWVIAACGRHHVIPGWPPRKELIPGEFWTH